METDFPDSRKISETILFLSDCWEVSNRYEHVDVTGFPIRFDNLLKHRIHGTKIAVLEVRGSTSSKQNQISAIGLMSRSLVGIDHIVTLSGRLNTCYLPPNSHSEKVWFLRSSGYRENLFPLISPHQLE